MIPSPETTADAEESVDEKQNDTLSRDIMIQVVDEEGNTTQHKWIDGKSYLELAAWFFISFYIL